MKDLILNFQSYHLTHQLVVSLGGYTMARMPKHQKDFFDLEAEESPPGDSDSNDLEYVNSIFKVFHTQST